MAERSEELIDQAEASQLLEVEPARIDDMVDEEMLTPIGEGPDRRFRRAEVLALREQGG